jgi:hypothetical protein
MRRIFWWCFPVPQSKSELANEFWRQMAAIRRPIIPFETQEREHENPGAPDLRAA